MATWAEQANAISIDGRGFINGARVNSIGGQTFDCKSPIDGRTLAQIMRGDKADVDAAVKAARAAFNDKRWAGKAPAARKRVLQKWADLIDANKANLALLETLDMGKPISYAQSVDVGGTSRCIRWYAEAIDKVYDEIAPTGSGSLAMITREPMGVVGAIVPWNYPMVMTAWKLAPALATGNSVVLKPSEKSPLTAMRLAELALEAGLPAGVLNVVPGFGHEAGEALALHMGVDALGFTGSTRTGRRMFAYSSESNLKRVYNELGGKSANIIFNDYRDIEHAAKTAVACMMFNQGQSCNAPSRLMVQADIAAEVEKVILAELPKFAVKNPLQDDCVMGALVDETQMNTVLSYIQHGIDEGANLLAGGRRVMQETGGFYVEPTVFSGVSNQMKIAREEIFGPVLSILRFETEADALAMANDSDYGLQAGVWSSNIDRAHRVARNLQAGTVHVNQYDDDDMTVPFGGYKQSGNGRDKSLHAFEKYTELKTTWIKLNAA